MLNLGFTTPEELYVYADIYNFEQYFGSAMSLSSKPEWNYVSSYLQMDEQTLYKVIKSLYEKNYVIVSKDGECQSQEIRTNPEVKGYREIYGAL